MGKDAQMHQQVLGFEVKPASIYLSLLMPTEQLNMSNLVAIFNPVG